jgi:hypothetical protein
MKVKVPRIELWIRLDEWHLRRVHPNGTSLGVWCWSVKEPVYVPHSEKYWCICGQTNPPHAKPTKG